MDGKSKDDSFFQMEHLVRKLIASTQRNEIDCSERLKESEKTKFNTNYHNDIYDFDDNSSDDEKEKTDVSNTTFISRSLDESFLLSSSDDDVVDDDDQRETVDNIESLQVVHRNKRKHKPTLKKSRLLEKSICQESLDEAKSIAKCCPFKCFRVMSKTRIAQCRQTYWTRNNTERQVWMLEQFGLAERYKNHLMFPVPCDNDQKKVK